MLKALSLASAIVMAMGSAPTDARPIINMNPEAAGSYGRKHATACTPYARMMCASVIKNKTARVDCLRRNVGKVSEACRALIQE